MRDGRQTEDMFVSEANRAPSSTAEKKSRMVDRLFVWDGKHNELLASQLL